MSNSEWPKTLARLFSLFGVVVLVTLSGSSDWFVINAEGKYVEGEIEAINQEEASHKLKEQKVIITNLIRSKKKKGESKAKSKGGGFSFGKKKVKVEDILIFSKQFATMVKAGLPILEVLAMLRDQLEGPAIKDIVEDIRKSLEGGVTLSKCFEKYPKPVSYTHLTLPTKRIV